MPKKTIVLLPETEKILEQMGLQIKYARLRRKLTSELVAERAGISRATLVSIEKGSPSVAMANWIDRYEYAITLDDSNTIIYVYLQNMDAKDIHMQSDYLPKYFQDNNAGKHQDTDPMTSDYRSFYAFRIGDHYIDCMDLADQIEIADTEPETQAADVAQEVESN